MTKKAPHVMMMAAGTGGHVFPALAVATQLQQQGTQVSWLVTPEGMENRLLASQPFPRYPIDIQGVRGGGFSRKLMAPFKIIKATFAAMRILHQKKVDAVAGFGGYVSGPGGLAARILGIPILIHEQNAIAGFTNQQLSRIAKIVCQAFPETFPESEKIETTGNPVREQICRLPAPIKRYSDRANKQAPIHVLVVGGSLGAQALNQYVPQSLADLGLKLRVTHQCGQQQLEETTLRYAELRRPDIDVRVVAFIQEMAHAYAEADVIICRAGALTVTEIATAGVAAVFVPLPTAVDDHQTANAQYLEKVAAARICPQSQLEAWQLSAVLLPMMQREILQKMAEHAQQHAQFNATEQVAAHIQQLLSSQENGK